MNIKEDYNLRENAEIVSLAMECSTSLDSTKLKEWFKNKYENHIQPPPDSKSITSAWKDWCHLTGNDPNDLLKGSAFYMGAKLAISNDGWRNHKI